MLLSLLLCLLSGQAKAVPLVPAFKQGTLTSHTETTSKVNETIVSENFSTGYEWSVSGVNVETDGPLNVSPKVGENGWTGLTHERPNWNIVTPGAAFQYVEVLSGPGLKNITTIQRTTEVTSITDTVSSFSE